MNLHIFYLLGFINNYAGGFSTKDGIFQRITHLEDWEISLEKILISKKLIRICEQLLLEENYTNDIKIEEFKAKNGIIIYSKNIVEIINNSLQNKSYFMDRDYFLLDSNIFDEFDWQNENSTSYQQRVKFLSGVIDSNAKNNEFTFYNDYKKCMLTHYVLSGFADEEDKLLMESYFKTPHVTRISVNQNGKVWEIIKKYCH